LNRFYERIGIKPEILLALVIIHYGDILANIMENRQKLENGDFIEIPIIHEDLRFKIVVRKDKYSDKFVIKTVKYWNFLDYKLQKLRRLSYVIWGLTFLHSPYFICFYFIWYYILIFLFSCLSLFNFFVYLI